MIGILLTKLELKNNKYYYEGAEYNGVVFDAYANGKIQAHHYVNGVKAEPYKSKFLPENQNDIALYLMPQVLLDEISAQKNAMYTGDVFLYKNFPFTGYVYAFDKKGYCYYEAVTNQGAYESFVEYFIGSMQLSELALTYKGYEKEIYEFHEFYQFCENGNLSSLNFYKSFASQKKKYSLSFNFSKKSEVERISSMANIPNEIEGLFKELRLEKYASFEKLMSYGFSKELRLYGEGIDEDFIDLIVDQNSFKNIKTLNLCRVGLTEKSVEKIKQINSSIVLNIQDR